MSLEILQEIAKKGKPQANKKLLQLISMSFTGEPLIALEKGIRNTSEKIKAIENENVKDPRKFISILRHIFDAHKSDADIMLALVQLLKVAVTSLGEDYVSNAEHIRTK